MATSSSEQFSIIDDSVPQWKKELILRRRSVGRSSGTSCSTSSVACLGSSVSVFNSRACVTSPVSHQSAMRLVDPPVTGNGDFNLIPDIRELMTVQHRNKMGEEKKSAIGNNGKNKDGILDNDSDSSEELQYGPGIVSKLKTRYLSLTLRETHYKSRPTLNVFRRATSLENLLDQDDSTKEQNIIDKTVFNKNTPSVVNNNNTTGGRYTGRGLNRGNDNMKRARSVDTLSRYERITTTTTITVPDSPLTPEPPVNNRCSLEEHELPPPDLVKQTLRIFERSPSKNNRLKKIIKLNSANKITTTTINNNITSANKPELTAKPIVIVDELNTPTLVKETPSVLEPEVKQIIEDKTPTVNNIEQQPVVNKKPTIAMRRKDFRKSGSFEKIVSPLEKSPIFKTLRSSIDEEPKSEHDKIEDETDNVKVKEMTESSLKNIRKGSMSVDFKFKETSSKTYLPKVKPVRPSSMDLSNGVSNNNKKQNVELNLTPTRPISPVLAKAPPSILSREITNNSPMKQVGVIRPIVTNKTIHASKTFPTNKYCVNKTQNLTEQELEKNFINTVKSIEQPVTKVVVSLKKSPEECFVNNVVNDEEKKKKQQINNTNTNTMVFNFSDRKTVPDYIENDGMVLTGKRERPKPGEGGIIFLGGGTDDCSTDYENEDSSLDYSDPLSPCNILFEGDNVLINGKSNLRKEPKQRKLRIQFNDQATTLFEYPSEASLLDDNTTQQSTSSVTPPPVPSPGLRIPLGGSSLASYTPSKLSLDTDFQLGVTRTPQLQQQQAIPMIDDNVDNEDYLKPADDKDTVAWSAGTASDLLF